MQRAYILVYMGKPIVVSDSDERVHRQAVSEARLSASRTHRGLTWNVDRTRLFRTDSHGHVQFTGYEIREVVKA